MEGSDLQALKSNLDQFFLLVNGMFVLFMQAGFAFLEAGSVRSKNTTNIIMKNVLDVFIGAVMYYAVGYGFAYGQPGNGFIGDNNFFAINVAEDHTNMTANHTEMSSALAPELYYAGWFYQFVFAATASTIVSGAMAERTEFTTYMVYCLVLTGFVYPVVSHWGWAENGWLNSGAGTGLSYIDFAGSGIVHILGGTAALVGAAILGPRIGRFNKDGTYNDIPGHSVTVAALGAFILFVGFLAFNGGSQLAISNPGDGLAVSIAVMNTIIGGSISAIVTMILFKMTDAIRGQDHYWSLINTMNGGLAGMVALCAGCNDYNPWSAVVIGIVAGVSFLSWHHLILKIKIDDPLDAVAVHLGGGLTGILMAPIFVVNGLEVDGEYVGGIVYGAHPMAFKSFGWNLLGAITIMAWTASLCTIMFGSMKYFGFLRVSETVERLGMDKTKHGEPAYPIAGYDKGEHPHKNACESLGNGCYANPANVEYNDETNSAEKSPQEADTVQEESSAM